MAAAAYKVTLIVQNDDGNRFPYTLTASDVNGEYWLHQSGGSELPLSSIGCTIVDVIYSAAGTDTSQVEIYIGGVSTGIRIYNAMNLYNGINRQMSSALLRIPAGAFVKFKQLT